MTQITIDYEIFKNCYKLLGTAGLFETPENQKLRTETRNSMRKVIEKVVS